MKDLITAAAIIIVPLGLYLLLYYFVRQRAKKEERVLANLLKSQLYYPGFFLVFISATTIAFPFFRDQINPRIYDGLNHLLKVLTILAFGFLAIKSLSVLKGVAYHRYKKEDQGSLQFRKLDTQFQLIQRILNTAIVMGTVAAALMTFPGIKNVGTTILASAGVLGIILGFAAQKSIGTFFSGLQIAIAQPIRIGDVVVVEEVFGTIGEINLTFVVVNTWDGRRRIVPINYFLENSFESWTRVSPEVVAKVKIRADYTLPIEKIKAEFKIWLEESTWWDKRTSGFLITGADEKSIEVRATMSAKNSDDAWDLECYIREKLITYIQKNCPAALPKSRIIINAIQKPEELSDTKF
jgi:small-conductance mechanosensitive channel